MIGKNGPSSGMANLAGGANDETSTGDIPGWVLIKREAPDFSDEEPKTYFKYPLE
jgi:hypothetical protein